MEKVGSGLHFRIMSWAFKLRDILEPRESVLQEADLKEGFRVLDYGCGPGSYVVPAARMVGETGQVYALDIHPLAIKMVNSIANKKQLRNVTTIQSDCGTGLPENSLDAVLLYDVLHDLKEYGNVLKELHRVLKPGGILSVHDHHLQENDIVARVTEKGLFKLVRKGRKTYTFVKAN
ncbi:MAG: class I SAM-dependent methyltransferase [Desulfotomaculales bacterium]